MTENISEKEMKSLIPVNRFGTAEEVAHLVAFLVSPESGYITGEVISINGGFTLKTSMDRVWEYGSIGMIGQV